MGRLAVVLMSLGLAASAWGQRPDRPVRELLLEVPVAIVVEPVDVKMPGKLKVVEVLRGDRVKVGDIVNGAQLAAGMTDELGPDWLALDRAILFGEPGARPSEPFQMLPTGARLVTRTGKVWRAVTRPGGGFRLAAESVEWDRLLGRLRGDVADMAALETLRKQPEGARRNQALLDWLEKHPQGKVAAPVTPNPAAPADDLGGGWGELETEPVRWILRTGSVEDSWAALALYARLHEGALVGRECHPFATPEGRALLLEKVKDERGLGGDALRALKMLGWAETYPKAAVPMLAFAKPLEEKEQETLTKEMRALLAKEDARWKQGAARALVAVLGARETAEETRAALVKELDEQRKGMKAGTTRNVLAEAAFRLSPKGGPPLALLLDMGHREQKVYFWLGVYPEGSVVPEVPQIHIETVVLLGKGETALDAALPCPVPPDWKVGWDTRRPLFVEVPLTKLKPGQRYRITVSGVVGPEKTKFTSEPRIIQVVGPMQPNQPGPVRVVLDDE
jgi:hypothetical protein